jgi:hypothetical protein
MLLKDILKGLRKKSADKPTTELPKVQRDLAHNEVVEVAGQKYVRVQVRLADTADANTAKIWHNLEAENELLKAEVFGLQATEKLLQKKVTDLQQLNTNLCKLPTEQERKHRQSTELHHREVANLRNTLAEQALKIEVLKHELNNKDAAIGHHKSKAYNVRMRYREIILRLYERLGSKPKVDTVIVRQDNSHLIQRHNATLQNLKERLRKANIQISILRKLLEKDGRIQH